MRLIIVAACVAMSGCAQFTNRIVMTVACDEVHFASRWMKYLAGADIDPRDAKVILDAHCRAAAEAARPK